MLSDQKIILLVWAEIDAKGYANVHFNAYFYGEMTFINGQRRDKQTARETIICRLAAGNFEDETASVQNIIYRMTAEKFK